MHQRIEVRKERSLNSPHCAPSEHVIISTPAFSLWHVACDKLRGKASLTSLVLLSFHVTYRYIMYVSSVHGFQTFGDWSAEEAVFKPRQLCDPSTILRAMRSDQNSEMAEGYPMDLSNVSVYFVKQRKSLQVLRGIYGEGSSQCHVAAFKALFSFRALDPAKV
jgi:hypothetical protein